MIFGDTQFFAIEAILEPSPKYGPVSGNNIAGRIRIWMSGNSVGDFNEPHCWLGPPYEHLAEMSQLLDELWHQSFVGLNPQEIFDRLNLLVFGVERQGCNDGDNDLSDRTREERGMHNFLFLLHSSEAFDGSKGFLVHPPGSDLVAMVAQNGSDDVTSFRFSVESFRRAVSDFGEWIKAQEHRLLPHLNPMP